MQDEVQFVTVMLLAASTRLHTTGKATKFGDVYHWELIPVASGKEFNELAKEIADISGLSRVAYDFDSGEIIVRQRESVLENSAIFQEIDAAVATVRKAHEAAAVTT